MRLYKKLLSYRHWIAVIRRQPKHMQHVYAALFSGGITLLLAMGILYFDYGFWRERYVRIEENPVESQHQEQIVSKSPLEMMSSFFSEAKVQLGSIGSASTSILEGKEVYTKDDTASETTEFSSTSTPQ